VSRSVDLFIASSRSIEEVAAEMARLAEMELTPGPDPGTWVLDEGTVHAELRAHPYVNDGDLPFERYQYALSARVSDGARPTDSAEANLLRMVSESLRKGPYSSLLVHDLQFRDGPPRGGPADPAGAAEADRVAGASNDPPDPDGPAGESAPVEAKAQ
jgi:hypothetical protein